VVELFGKNRLTVTRQVPCHAKGGEILDMLLALKGLPIGTCELKNPGTGQTWRHAVKQYREGRDPGAPLFQFEARALVHFAVDPDEVHIHMTTRLLGEHTRFLPFNRGSDPGTIRCGAGNPAYPSGYRTGYFWEEVLAREGLLEILGSFMLIERKEEKREDAKGKIRRVTKETLFFPRFHQLDAVRLLVRYAVREGAGHNSLTQHSAGSGKTNTISWLAHRLASLHTDGELKVFDCVVVITDRQVLDRQLQDAIYQIEHAQDVVKAIDEDDESDPGCRVGPCGLGGGGVPRPRRWVARERRPGWNGRRCLTGAGCPGSRVAGKRLGGRACRRPGDPRPPTEPELLRLHGNAQAQDAGTVRVADRP